jgi:hypothetical protein
VQHCAVPHRAERVSSVSVFGLRLLHFAAVSAEASAILAPTTSAPAEAFKSLWRMLSLNKSKPTADANLTDEEAAKRQISAQLALAREVSEPAVIQAASDDQLQRPADLPQPSLASDADTDRSQAAALAKQPSAMAKRFSFLSTLRRGSTTAESDSRAEAQLPEIPESLTEQTEGAAAVPPAEAAAQPAAVPTAAAAAQPAAVPTAAPQGKAERVAANPIELPPVFEYGSDADGSGSPGTPNAPAVTIVTTEVCQLRPTALMQQMSSA